MVKKKKTVKKWHPQQCNPQLLFWFSKYKKKLLPQLFQNYLKKKSLSCPLPKIPGHKGENGYVILKTQKGNLDLQARVTLTVCPTMIQHQLKLCTLQPRGGPSSLSQNYTKMRTPEQTHTHTHRVAAWLAGLLWTTLFTQMILWSLVLIALVSSSAFTHVLLLVWNMISDIRYPNAWLLVLFVCFYPEIKWALVHTERQNYGICEAKLNKCYVWSDCFLFVCGLK